MRRLVPRRVRQLLGRTLPRSVVQRRRWRRRAAETLGPPAGRKVAVLADAVRPRHARRWLRQLAGDRVTVYVVGPEPEGVGDGGTEGGWGGSAVRVAELDTLVDRLTRAGAHDLVVVALGRRQTVRLASDHAALFAELFLHLRPGGRYVIDRAPLARRGTGAPGAAVAEQLRRMVTTARRARSGRGLRRPLRVARNVERLDVSDDAVVATKRARHVVKLRQEQLDVVTEREPGLDVRLLESRPAGTLEPSAGVTSYGPAPADVWPARIPYPEQTVRHYRGDVVSLKGSRLVSGDTLLPESLRWPHARVLHHARLQSVTPLMTGVRPKPRAPTETTDGDYYFVDSLFSGHFGHLTTEMVCRLWGWDRAKQENPDLRALFHTNTARGKDGSLERRLLTAYGIPDADIVSFDAPVRLRSVVAASPLWHNAEPHHVSPDIRETWARLTAGLLAGASPAEHERIFVSRGASLSHRRGCRNQAEVERCFADHGFHVFYPEEHDLAEQVALFAGARAVAGFAGSAMFNLMHSARVEQVVVIGHNEYDARNEHLFASVLGAELHYFWQQAEPPPAGVPAVRSPYSFDFAGQGDALGRVLEDR